jgi:hypothetical protein
MPRSMQAHKSVEHAGLRGCPEMDGSDHVSSAQMLIGWRGSLDLENERLAGGHAAPMDGQDFEVVDWLRFPLQCFF